MRKISLILVTLIILINISACGSQKNNTVFSDISGDNIEKIIVYNPDKEITDSDDIKKIIEILKDISLKEIKEEQAENTKEGGYLKLTIYTNNGGYDIISRSDKIMFVNDVCYEADKYITRSDIDDILK